MPHPTALQLPQFQVLQLSEGTRDSEYQNPFPWGILCNCENDAFTIAFVP